MKFGSVVEFWEIFKDWCIRMGIDYMLLRNEPASVTTVCKFKESHGCTWRLHASPIMGGATFQVKVLQGSCKCGHRDDNSHADYKYLGKRIVDTVRTNRDQTIAELQTDIHSKVKITVSKFKVIRAKAVAVKELQGDNVE